MINLEQQNAYIRWVFAQYDHINSLTPYQKERLSEVNYTYSHLTADEARRLLFIEIEVGYDLRRRRFSSETRRTLSRGEQELLDARSIERDLIVFVLLKKAGISRMEQLAGKNGRSSSEQLINK